MQHGALSNKENIGCSLSHTHTECMAKNRFQAGLLLGLVFLGLTFFSLVSCNISPTCSSSSLDSACPAVSKPTMGTQPPAKKPTVPTLSKGNGKSKPSHSSSVAATASPTPTPISVNSDEQLVKYDAESYDKWVLDGSESAYYKAYNKLDVSLRDQVSFDDFVRNANFTLGKGCWQDHRDHITLTQVDSTTWIAALPMTKVTCVDETSLGQYIWYFKVHLVYGNLPEIVAVALQQTS